jgi:hypothetical protein
VPKQPSLTDLLDEFLERRPGDHPRRILVCGSRNWTDKARIRRVLLEYMPPADCDEPVVIHGNARGADKLAGDIAMRMGFWVESHPANWTKHGKKAGPIRNRQMMDRRPDLVIAFGEGRGTQDTVDEAKRRGIPVRREL